MATAPTTGDAPPTTGDAPPTTGDAPPTTGDAPPTTGDAPPTTGDAPPTTGDAPQAVPAGSGMRARVLRAVRREARAALRAARAVLGAAWAAGPKRRIRLIDLLRVLGLARRAVPRAVVGPKAYPQWWQRLLALVTLIALVAVIGFVLAAAVGLMVVVAGFLLEQAIS